MSFLETPRFPDWIARWAVGGIGFQTTIARTDGGAEYRNANWSEGLGSWTFQDGFTMADANSATYGQKLLRNFFNVALGMANGFRFKDFSDYTDEGGGVFLLLTATTFQMQKNYTSGAATYTRTIKKPVSGTLVVTGGSVSSIDYTTGIVTMSSGTPTSWTGQFDCPVRFGDDMNHNGLDPSGAIYDWQNIRLEELRNP
jgi:uncharacterized protein (TIGR02217 family)